MTSVTALPTTLAQRHMFGAVAFAENFRMRSLAASLQTAQRTAGVAVFPAGSGTVYAFSFGVLVFHNVATEEHAAIIDRVRPHLEGSAKVPVISEERFEVAETPGAQVSMEGGKLVLDSLTPNRAGVIALTLAQSAAMEYYEAIIQKLSEETAKLIEHLRKTGSAPMRIRSLHRFIGEAISTRNEVLSVLHLLDKPDATWDDPGMDRIYSDLRAEFELADRFDSLETKLRGMQEALELILDVVRDRRLVLLETTVVLLILFEILLMVPTFFRH
ncbi:MAG: RMD1 family protein [Deltaproteobacteria bacterium]|nr:RMD1 family protein [Deltaproteobacteria bacterium]